MLKRESLFLAPISEYKTDWQTGQATLRPDQTLFVFEVVRGGNSDGEDQGDVCIDDVSVTPGACCKFALIIFPILSYFFQCLFLLLHLQCFM